tara:strand:- start:274 stop:612 length:339 start_codon:yes stop_codon:yes gene_type:complete
MFGCLSLALQGGKQEKVETHADIVAKLKSEVKAILQSELESMDGTFPFVQDLGGKGELAFIINLVPMYKLIGGRGWRLAEGPERHALANLPRITLASVADAHLHAMFPHPFL